MTLVGFLARRLLQRLRGRPARQRMTPAAAVGAASGKVACVVQAPSATAEQLGVAPRSSGRADGGRRRP